MKFKVGDRVRVYGFLNPCAVAKGIIVDLIGPIVVFNEDGDLEKQRFSAHHKQCRRLVKKERRRLWIQNTDLKKLEESPHNFVLVTVSKVIEIGFTEFREIK